MKNGYKGEKMTSLVLRYVKLKYFSRGHLLSFSKTAPKQGYKTQTPHSGKAGNGPNF